MNPGVACYHDPRGSLWYRWDLHFHTPASFEYNKAGATNNQIVDSLLNAGIRTVAITDHHKIDIPSIRDLQKLGGERLSILPGIELRDDHGGTAIHYICIFPEDGDLEHIWTVLQGKLGLTNRAIREKGGDERIYVPIEEGAKVARELGGVVSIHAGVKSNSIENISNREQFQQRIKYDITNQWVDLMEIGQLKDIESHLKTIFPDTGLNKPLIICSDNHDITNYQVKAPLWLRADPTFRGLLMAIREPRDRIFIGERPSQLTRIERNQTKYIRGISFKRLPTAPDSQQWFQDTLLFNPGLVAIIGNKGSGKSALADTIGLLGSTKNSDSFSFLNDRRFRHPTAGFAGHFESTIEWESGEKLTRCLEDEIDPDEVERLKYLPQEYVEKVCNELIGVGEQAFEQELKSVIFSHVPEVQRLGQTTMDKLVQFRTEEKQRRIDSLIRQLRDASRSRATLEAENDPLVRRTIKQKIRMRELELESLDKTKPIEQPDPALTPTVQTDPALLAELTSAQESKRSINDKISQASLDLGTAERRLAVVTRLIEELQNFQKDFELFKVSLETDVSELGIKTQDLLTLSINFDSIEKLKRETTNKIKSINKLLQNESPPGPIGLVKELSDIDKKIEDLQSKLDAPSRAYQQYLKDLDDWNQTRESIIGSKSDPESLKGLQFSVSVLDALPEKIEQQRTRQIELAKQIYVEKLAQASVYQELYKPIQSFIDSHELSKGKLELEFRVGLSCEGFTNGLLSLLALNKRGSFMGIDEGNAVSEKLVRKTNWDNLESVHDFLEAIDTALHQDQRDKKPRPTLLKDQLVKGTEAADVFNFLYSLEYIRPRYMLLWEGKPLDRLSPGERGTLLLVFYLLVEKEDFPLIIDQPEGNLDNYTITKVLVDCIKTARNQRQVFIVTHNPNLAVVCDADQVIHSNIDKDEGNSILYTTGALENPIISKYVTDVLEGTRWAFDVRGNKYEVGTQKHD
jgi:predicted metal-dependent phosphoesterase TrpH